MALASIGLGTSIFNNNLKSVLLLAAFPVLLLSMLGAFFFGVDYFSTSQLGGGGDPRHAWVAAQYGVFHYGQYAFGAALIWFIIAYFFQGSMIRAAAHARPVTRAEMPRIYNLLENLCISRGIPMPAFEVIDTPAMNAFASGLSEKDFRITLTRGLIESLDDQELEGVIAHELTHILNRDVRLLVVSVIFVGIISFLAQLLYRGMIYGNHASYYSRRDDRRGGSGGVVLIALAVLAVGYVLAIVIRFALSRKREYLADAGAIELTHNPEAMMRALMRISGRSEIADMPQEVSQMCIENTADFMGIFATHPPINDRIRTISEMTGTPVPALPVSLRRAPDRPWAEAPHEDNASPKGPWG